MSTSIDSVARSTAPPTTARSGDSGARLTVRPAPATAGVSRHALNLPRILPPKPNPDAPSLDTRSLKAGRVGTYPRTAKRRPLVQAPRFRPAPHRGEMG